MTRILELLTSIVIVVALFVLVGVFLPDQRTVQQSVDTSHPIRQVYDTMNSFKRFHEWNPLRQHDPRVAYSISGPEAGVGARLDYDSVLASIGQGSWHITGSEQDESISHSVYNDAYGRNKKYDMQFRQRGKIVEIDWTYSVSYGWNLAGRYAGMYVDRTVGDDMKRGLANLSNLLASMPNFDYSNLDAQIIDIPVRNILYVTTTADRNITAVENAMDVALKDIRAAIRANGLHEVGHPRLITTNFGSEKYEFDVAIPVALVSEDDDAEPTESAAEAGAEANDSAGDGEGSEASAEAEAEEEAVEPALEPLEDLQLPDNVHSGQSYAGRAVSAPYRGHPAALPLIRDQLRSYAAAFGEELQDRSFEEYLTEIEETAAEDAQFRVYWPIK